MRVGKRIAFDFGTVRIGVAISDASGLLATPYKAISNSERTEEELLELFNEVQPIYIAIGLPQHLSGDKSSTQDSVMVFVENIRKNFPNPIYGIDERLSTVGANKRLKAAGHDSRSMKTIIDSAAAVEILERALELEKFGNLEKCEI